jgi:serine/threonine protein kinase
MVFREVEILKSLQHTNIVKIYNCFTLPQMQIVFVMEYLEGGELTEYIEQKGHLEESEAPELFA